MYQIADKSGRPGATRYLISFAECKINLLERVENVCRVGVVSKIEFYVVSCPSVRTARLNKLEEKMGDEITNQAH